MTKTTSTFVLTIFLCAIFNRVDAAKRSLEGAQEGVAVRMRVSERFISDISDYIHVDSIINNTHLKEEEKKLLMEKRPQVFSTVLIEAKCENDAHQGEGTGFIAHNAEDPQTYYLITNRHVLTKLGTFEQAPKEDGPRITHYVLYFHLGSSLKEEEERKNEAEKNFKVLGVSIPIKYGGLLLPEDEEVKIPALGGGSSPAFHEGLVDVAAIKLNGIFDKIRGYILENLKGEYEPLFYSVPIPNSRPLVSIGDNVISYGYPDGHKWNGYMGMVARGYITSCAPHCETDGLEIDLKQEKVTDFNVHLDLPSGASGSPVFMETPEGVVELLGIAWGSSDKTHRLSSVISAERLKNFKVVGVETKFKNAQKYENMGNLSKAFIAYQTAAKMGHKGAMFQYAYLLFKDDFPFKNPEESFKWFKKIADDAPLSGATKQQARAQQSVGYSYWKGSGVEQNLEQALTYFHKALFSRHSEVAQEVYVHLARMYQEKGKYELSYGCYKALRNIGNPKGAAGLGFLYENGLGVPKSIEDAMHYYKKAADANHGPAMGSLSYIYYAGKDGIREDLAAARKWAENAIKEGYTESANTLRKIAEKEKRQRRAAPNTMQLHRKSGEKGARK